MYKIVKEYSENHKTLVATSKNPTEAMQILVDTAKKAASKGFIVSMIEPEFYEVDRLRVDGRKTPQYNLYLEKA